MGDMRYFFRGHFVTVGKNADTGRWDIRQKGELVLSTLLSLEAEGVRLIKVTRVG